MKKEKRNYFKEAWAEAKKQKELDRRKQELLNADMNYAFLEEIIQKINENPQLQVRITLTDGTILDVNTKPRQRSYDMIPTPKDDFLEVR